ncbi:MAG: hypothetical protein BWY06_02621 [Candidatus Latescibacteria bacterium ADurb.Bin168]|nr:MAG: hypothetical protein BWY06_02621 [Candidatus Latescibacteria bacterium ADurb.Bin168]
MRSALPRAPVAGISSSATDRDNTAKSTRMIPDMEGNAARETCPVKKAILTSIATFRNHDNVGCDAGALFGFVTAPCRLSKYWPSRRSTPTRFES